MRTRGSTCPTSAPPSAPSSSWRRWLAGRAAVRRAVGCSCRRGRRIITRSELPLRAPPHPRYPPHVGLARFVALDEDPAAAEGAAERVAAWLRRANAERLAGALTVLGPAPCPIMRLRGRWRWHVLVKSAEPRAIGRVVRAWGASGPRTVVVDRDPVSLL